MSGLEQEYDMLLSELELAWPCEHAGPYRGWCSRCHLERAANRLERALDAQARQRMALP